MRWILGENRRMIDSRSNSGWRVLYWCTGSGWLSGASASMRLTDRAYPALLDSLRCQG